MATETKEMKLYQEKLSFATRQGSLTEADKKEIEEFFYMHFINDSGDRGTVTSIDGNTDLFHGFTRNYDPLNKEIFLELVRDGNSGTFDNMFPSWQKALNEVDSYV